MMTQTELFSSLDTLCHNYETLLVSLNRLSESCPEGSLFETVRNGQRYCSRRVMYNGQRTQIAIPLNTKDGLRLLRQLREKRVIMHGRRLLRKNIRVIKKALSQLTLYDPDQLSRMPSTKELLEEAVADSQPLSGALSPLPDRVFLPSQLNAGKWIRDTLTGNYRTNPYFLEDLKHESSAGRWLRSKSEADWDDELTEAGALFRYDSEIRLKSGKVIYADFVVLLPGENRLVIIEHFGRMDDPRYAMKNMRRLQEYAESGYILGRDLFFTMETKASPLTRSQIRATMRQAGLL